MINKLREKVNSGEASEDEKSELRKRIYEVSNEILNLPDDQLFNVEHIKTKIPEKARIFESLKYPKCGEMISKHRIKSKNGNFLCIPCYNYS